MSPRAERFLDAVHGDGPPLVMGVLNVTPDSFSDGGRFASRDAAFAHARALIEAGADIIDIGGESTRPGADAVSEDEELARILPLVVGVRAAAPDAAISVDTMKPAVARAALSAGADVWNDVAALRFAPDACAVAAELGAPVVLMHMRGAPKTMQAEPHYDDVVAEVIAFLRERAAAAEAAGVDPRAILVDPGIGFGKTLDHNLSLMCALPRIAAETGKPVVFGASRKRFIQAIDSDARDAAGDRLGGSLAAALWAGEQGARVIRVHDVRETAQALRVRAAIAAEEIA